MADLIDRAAALCALEERRDKYLKDSPAWLQIQLDIHTIAALPAQGVSVKPTDEPEDGEIRQAIVTAKWKPCVSGGGWWVAQDVDGQRILLSPDGFLAALAAIREGWG